MSKATRILWLVLITVMLAGGFFLIFRNSNNVPANEPVNFTETGNLIKDNPGLKAGVWYLSYEKPGQPGLNRELAFNEISSCAYDIQTYACTDFSLEAGQRVRIEGVEKNERVTVRRLLVLE